MTDTLATKPQVDDDGFAASFEDIEAAARRIAPYAIRTPLLEWPEINERFGGRLLVKPEVLQRTGSFKIRGAVSRVSLVAAEGKAKGVLAPSSGNHGQAVAAAARIFRLPAIIVMPSDAPAIKVERTREHGATIVTYDRYKDDREAVAERVAAEHGYVLVHPYDSPMTIAGQGTMGMEICQQAAEKGVEIDRMVVCTGGGGLLAGTALAFHRLSPKTELYASEPEGFDDTARSLAAGRRLANEPSAKSICDAVLTPTPGNLTFPINSRLVKAGLVVSDADAKAAMRFAFERMRLVVEPGGAVALAAITAGKLPLEGRTVCVTLSGGNVDPALFARVILGS